MKKNNQKNTKKSTTKNKSQKERDFDRYIQSIKVEPLGHLRESLKDDDCLSYL